MSEVKRYYIMESAVGTMRDELLTYTPLVNYKTDVHVVPLVMASDYARLEQECERLRAAAAEYADALTRIDAHWKAELAALKGGQVAVGVVYTMEALVPGGSIKSHASLNRDLPAGTKLYALWT